MDLHITSYGARIRVKGGLFVVKYFDDQRIEHTKEYAPVELDCIWLSKGTSLSVDVINLATINDIEVIFLGNQGKPLGRFSTYAPHGSSKVLKAQFVVSVSPELSFPIVQELIAEKLENEVKMLEKIANRRDSELKAILQPKIEIIKKAAAKVRKTEGTLDNAMKERLRGIEGTGSRAFFSALNICLQPRYRFERRSRRPALDPFNACLNYAFSLLYAEAERALVRANINPVVGLMHREGYQLKSMVYDFIEPLRIDTIWVVFQLFARQKFNLTDHIKDYGARVELTITAKKMLIEAWNRYYNEKRVKDFGQKLLRRDAVRRRAEIMATQFLSTVKSNENANMGHV